jgi:hypothetical protein
MKLDKNRVYAHEAFKVDMQCDLHGLMEKEGLTRKDLANITGYSDEQVLDFFDGQELCDVNYLSMMTDIACAIGYEIVPTYVKRKEY